ncbi:hypothetical protein AB9K24_00325 [Meridianimaribacter flavus]
MKKTIGKPENWQDFESLCKKLWGEVWEIQTKIKKNGRLGQEQAGVDVYGIPKNATKYWGIQAKGKDDYAQAKLTEKEITTEIQKAKTFKPELEVYIIATTQNKDSKIEEFVRLKDIENRESGSFEILLYCWEDIVDLLEENQDTYQWYQHGIGQKGKFDFKISFNELEDNLTLNPIFEKKITKYKYTNKSTSEILMESLKSHRSILDGINPLFPFHSNKVNKSWCSFDFVMENTGSVVIEDWRVIIKFLHGVARLDDGTPLFPKLSLTESIDDESKTITYRPRDNNPLIQKDNRYFEIYLLPDTDSDKIVFEWELLARDFNRKEVAEISVRPEYIEKIEFELINDKEELKEDEIFISFHVVEKE